MEKINSKTFHINFYLHLELKVRAKRPSKMKTITLALESCNKSAANLSKNHIYLIS